MWRLWCILAVVNALSTTDFQISPSTFTWSPQLTSVAQTGTLITLDTVGPRIDLPNSVASLLRVGIGNNGVAGTTPLTCTANGHCTLSISFTLGPGAPRLYSGVLQTWRLYTGGNRIRIQTIVVDNSTVAEIPILLGTPAVLVCLFESIQSARTVTITFVAELDNSPNAIAYLLSPLLYLDTSIATTNKNGILTFIVPLVLLICGLCFFLIQFLCNSFMKRKG